MAYSAKIKSLS